MLFTCIIFYLSQNCKLSQDKSHVFFLVFSILQQNKTALLLVILSVITQNSENSDCYYLCALSALDSGTHRTTRQGLGEHWCSWPRCLCVISGVSDVQRRGHRLLPGGVGMASACSTKLVQTCHAGELWSPGLTG